MITGILTIEFISDILLPDHAPAVFVSHKNHLTQNHVNAGRLPVFTGELRVLTITGTTLVIERAENKSYMKKHTFSATAGKFLFTGLLLSTAFFASAQRERGERGNRGGEQRNQGRSFERQRDVQRPTPHRSNNQRLERREQLPNREIQRNNENRQRDWQRQQNADRSRDIQRNNENRQRQQQDAQRQRDIIRNNENRQRDWQRQQNVARSRETNRSFDNRRFEARVNNRSSVSYRRPPARNRVYAYNYRPRYSRPPVTWGSRRFYSFYNYSYHPYRPRYYGSFFHPVGFFSLRLGPAAISIVLNSRTYWYDQGVYYEPYNNGYQVIAAPEGAYISRLPVGFSTIDLGGNTYYYFAGTFYATSPQGFYVVEAPPGAIVYDLPEGCEEITAGDVIYLQHNNTVYQPIVIDGRNAYEVVELDEDYD